MRVLRLPKGEDGHDFSKINSETFWEVDGCGMISLYVSDVMDFGGYSFYEEYGGKWGMFNIDPNVSSQALDIILFEILKFVISGGEDLEFLNKWLDFSDGDGLHHEIESIKVPNMYHHHHTKEKMWNNN